MSGSSGWSFIHHFVNAHAGPKLPGDQVPHTMQARDLNDSITRGGLLLATGDCALFLLIDLEVQWRVTVVCGCLIQAVASSVLFDSMTPVAAWCNSFLLVSNTTHYYTIYLTTEGRGEKVGCVAASALHRVPVTFLPYS